MLISFLECLYGFYCDGMFDPFLKARCEGNLCKCSGNFVQTNCLREYKRIVMYIKLLSTGRSPSHSSNKKIGFYKLIADQLYVGVMPRMESIG